METNSPSSDLVSPESTVTSLLSSSGHLRSTLLPPEHNTSFTYRDKEYDSASAALDAYIADFDRSQNGGVSSGRLVIPPDVSHTPRRPSRNSLRNKSALWERLTDTELGFLKFPVSSLRHHDNRDRLSMTTDELLSIPHDGSMPVTHMSAFIQGFLPAESLPSSSAGCRSAETSFMSHPRPTRRPRNARCSRRPRAAMLDPGVAPVSDFLPANREGSRERPQPSSSRHLPRGFTGHKEEIECSGIADVPDVTDPAWIQSRDLREPPPPAQPHLCDRFGVPPSVTSRSRAPSWLAELEKDFDPTPAPVDGQRALRGLRLEFAEQISQLPADRKGSEAVDCLFKDNRLECLIQKADRVLNSLSQRSAGSASPAESASSGAACPVNTQDSAAAAGVTERGARDCCSIWKQPGPLEALKQMMFKLQALEAELQRRRPPPVPPAPQDTSQTPGSAGIQGPESEAEMEIFPCGPSLQRALHHLSHLKLLVGEPEGKLLEEDKDIDEGRYSSSSAERAACARTQ